MAFTSFFKQANSPTIYGTDSNGQNVAFENSQQFFQNGGAQDFSNVKTMATGPINSVNYSQYSPLGKNGFPQSTSPFNPRTPNSQYTPPNLNTTQPANSVYNGSGAPVINALSSAFAGPISNPDYNAAGIKVNLGLFYPSNNPSSVVPAANAQTNTNPSSGFIGPINQNPGQTTSTNNAGQPLNYGGQTVGGYDGSGSPFLFGNYSQQTQPDQNISATVPPETTSSSSLGSGPTGADVMSAFQKNLNNQDQLISQLQTLGTVPQSEQDLQAKVAKDQAAITGLNAQSAGLYNPDNQAIALPFLTGQAQNKLVSAQLQSTIDSALLNYAQGNRQFAFNSLKTVYDASRQNLLDTLQIYTQTAPQNLATNYNPSTGQVNAVMRNPLTGAQYTSDLGNIGAQHSFTSTNITTDPYSGALTFVGTTADGQVVTQPIGAGAGAFQGGSSSGGNLQGSTGQFNSSPTGLTTPAAVNNNPGNLRNPDGSWQHFSSPQQGFQALMNDIQLKQTGQSKTGLNGNSSLLQFTSVYAPASDGNDPTGYAASLAKQLGVSTGTPIGQIPTSSLASAVAQHEDGRYWNAITTGIGASGSALTAVPPSLQRYVENLNGVQNSEYINSNRVPQTLSNAIKLVDPNTVPVLTDSEVSTVKSLSTTTENLENMRTLANNILGNRGFGSIGSSINNFFQSRIPQITSNDVAKFKTFSDAAIKTIQGLASGATGLRINQTEIDTALNNMPTLYDSKESANAKLNQVESFLQNSLAQILPHAQLATTSTNGANANYTQILNQLAMGGQ